MARAKKPCSRTGCPELVSAGTRYCPDDQAAHEQQRGTRHQRGYDSAHERERAKWKPKVDMGTVHCHAEVCLMPMRLILLGQQWHLDHNDDRTGYRGPSHALCNVSAGGRASHRHSP